MERLAKGREMVEAAGLEVEIVSSGGTGTYDVTGKFPGVTEVQAGSYVVMDAKYLSIRPEFRPAVTLLSTVISCPAKHMAIADAGLKSVTTEFGLPQVVVPKGIRVKKLAEEHAILETDEGVDLKVGERIAMLPSHCCTTINLHDEFVIIERAREKERWPIEGRGKMR
jgi:D-serine deaminase-like pyridoxal phosphate-dependent protein